MMAISRRLRFEILRRDGYACRYCGAKAPATPLEVDHVIPVALGGSDEPSNLVTACDVCNDGKASVPADAEVVEDVAADAVRWAKAMKLAAFYAAVERDSLDQAVDEWGDAWCEWHRSREDATTVPRDPEWRSSIETFMKAGLSVQELNRLITVAMHSRARWDAKWKFFCGCCWRELSDMQERARQLIEDGMV